MNFSDRLVLLLLFFSGLLMVTCSDKKDAEWTFDLTSPEETGFDFVNRVQNTEDFNIFLYRNFYNGAGVGIGDINNDGLEDVYMTANMGSNKLFLNKGNFQFEDITERAGVSSEGKWSTGVSFVDINADGLLDIYVCNAGFQKGKDQKNELFINNGDLTFKQQAEEYGLADDGYSTHAAFFDYDKDGDLDVYVLNNSFIPVNTLNYSNKRALPAEEWPVKDFLKGGGDKLYRNDDGNYTDVTREAGIYSSLIGFGLGIAVGDVNDDGWDDIYVCNDFFERDYLYLNQRDGTFREDVKGHMNHISAFSMGADMADINNDGRLDLFVTDMLPFDPIRLKTTTSFEDYNIYQLKLERDFHHQYMHNTLQLNRGNGGFSEIAYFSGTSASDWSWGALLFDMNNDGLKDIYVSNGIFHDVTNQDFIDFFANEAILKMAISGRKVEVERIINKMPSVPLRNKVFMNNGNLTFRDDSEYEANQPSFSNGAAYGDLDNDGDLDLVVNNVNQQAFMFRNRSSETRRTAFLKIKLKGYDKNPFAIGTKVILHGEPLQTQHVSPFRGFQSSSTYDVIFARPDATVGDSLQIIWPDATQTVIRNLSSDSILVVDYTRVERRPTTRPDAPEPLLTEVDFGFDAHREDNFLDYQNEGLVIKLLSREGPCAAIGDVDGNSTQDIYFGGARNQPGRLYLQKSGGFYLSEQPQFLRDSLFEDTASKFFDADGDGDLDLLVGSGGNYTSQGTRDMQDRLYINDGKGTFSLKADAMPNNGFNTSVILPFDFDNDGDIDVFVGSRSVPGDYGVAPRSFLYRNNGDATFENVIREVAPSLERSGMITNAVLTDGDGDGEPELMVVGEWMSPKLFKIQKGRFSEIETNLKNHSGWWSGAISIDIDQDGDLDLVLGNRGENFYFSASHDRPSKLWIYDFDGNNTLDKVISTHHDGEDFPVHLKKELTQQINSLKKKNLRYSEYATKSMHQLFDPSDLEKATVLIANNFKSVIAINKGDFQYDLVPLPGEAQFSCINDGIAVDINSDGLKDLLLVGNRSGFLPQYSKLDASFGSLLLNGGEGTFRSTNFFESGFKIIGDATQIEEIYIDGKRHLLCLVNDARPRVFRVEKR